MSPAKTARLLWHQYRYDQRTFWRQPESVFFTVALPLIFLFLFVSIFGNDPAKLPRGGEVKGSTYYVPGIVALAIISATVVNLAITLTFKRERGVLKRMRATPLPPWVFMAGRIATVSVVSLLVVVAITVLGWLVYGVSVPGRTIPALVVTVLVATASCCAVGFALSAAIPNESAAPPVTNAVVLPLYFFSGVFIPNVPKWMEDVSAVFPIRHLFEAVLTAFDPATTGSGFEWGHLAVLAVWGVGATLVAVRYFRWTPSGR